MAVYRVTDAELTSIADAIRAKTGKSAQIEFPTEFVSEIGSISGGGGGGDIVLPDTYQKVDYLTCDGSQYTKVEQEMPNDVYIHGLVKPSTNDTFKTIIANYDSTVANAGKSFGMYTTSSGGASGGATVSIDGKASSILKSTVSSVNMKMVGIAKMTVAVPYFYLAKQATNGNQYPFTGAIYRIWVTDTGVLGEIGNSTFDFIPCYRKADNVPGFYELVNDVFYPSNGNPYILPA